MIGQALTIYVDGETLVRLNKAAEETGRTIEQLAADGAAEYMLTGFKDRPDEDPARLVRK